MARGRMLSKAISLDEKVESLSDDSCRLLFTWLIAHLDVEGRMFGDAQVIKAIVAPRRNWSVKRVENYLKKMESCGLIARYHANGFSYLCTPNFEKHQTGLRKNREKQSQIPPPPPELVRSTDGVMTDEVHSKIKFKIKSNKKRKEKGQDNGKNRQDFRRTKYPKPATTAELKASVGRPLD